MCYLFSKLGFCSYLSVTNCELDVLAVREYTVIDFGEVREYTLHDFNSFRFVEVCSTSRNMIYFDKCSLEALEKNVYFTVVGSIF